jgi:hypothetical protein
MSEIIKSISYSQEEILSNIIKLYLSTNTFDCDPTFSKGVFYKDGTIEKPRLCYDLYPQVGGIQKADCRNLPIEDTSLQSIIIDLPFLATTGPSLDLTGGNIINKRFGTYSSEKELQKLYSDTIIEAHRVLLPDGILVMKCQDKVSSGKQYMMHCDIYNWAINTGFMSLDLFVLLAKNRLIADWQRNQKHSRKFHSYFWVFKKLREGRIKTSA